MQFVINKIEYQEKLPIVMGKTRIGTIKGIWKYIKAPIVGNMYHVELNIDYPKEIDIPGKKELFPSVYLNGENVIFTGVCEDRDDEVYYLRFDIDWLDMLDIDMITSRKTKGDYISFSANWHDIGIYPYDL